VSWLKTRSPAVKTPGTNPPCPLQNRQNPSKSPLYRLPPSAPSSAPPQIAPLGVPRPRIKRRCKPRYQTSPSEGLPQKPYQTITLP
jgi:hypothetical protein